MSLDNVIIFWRVFVTGKSHVLASKIQVLPIRKARNWNLALQIVNLLITKAKIIQNCLNFREKTLEKAAKWTKSSRNASKTPKSSQNPPKIVKITPKSAEITVLLPKSQALSSSLEINTGPR